MTRAAEIERLLAENALLRKTIREVLGVVREYRSNLPSSVGKGIVSDWLDRAEKLAPSPMVDRPGSRPHIQQGK